MCVKRFQYLNKVKVISTKLKQHNCSPKFQPIIDIEII